MLQLIPRRKSLRVMVGGAPPLSTTRSTLNCSNLAENEMTAQARHFRLFHSSRCTSTRNDSQIGKIESYVASFD